MEQWIKEYAKKNEPYMKRCIFYSTCIEDVLDYVERKSKQYIYKEINYRTHETGYYLRFHKDNYRLDKNLWNRFKYHENKELCWVKMPKNSKIPDYTVLWYLSTYDEDFGGGILEFWDGQKILPKKNMAILFQSNDIHKVHRISWGNRSFIIIKFYT